LVWMSPVNCSEEPPLSSLAVIDWLRAVTLPAAALGVPPPVRVPPLLLLQVCRADDRVGPVDD